MVRQNYLIASLLFILFIGFLPVFAQSEGNAVSFDGTNDYINFSAASNVDAFDIDGSFTLEAWIYMNSITGARTILAKRDFTAGTPPSNTNYALRVDNGSLRLFWRANDNTLIDCYENNAPGGQASISATTWYHVAAVFDSSTMVATLYVDGSDVYSVAMASMPIPNDYPLVLGANYSSGSYGNDFSGIIDELRISNTTRYTNNFTTPTTPFLSDSNTVALFHFDKAPGITIAQNFVSSLNNDDGTLQGNATFTTTAPPLSSYADNALSLNGTTDYFSTGDSTALDLTTAITLEAWIKPTNVIGTHTILSKWDTTSANRSYRLTVENGSLQFLVSQNGTTIDTISSNGSINADRWTHVAGVYNGTNLYVFLNGVLDSTRAYSSDIYSGTSGFEAGAQNGANLFEGEIDEVRVSDNARYTTDFTIPTANFIADANTALLVHGIHSDYETVGKDASGNNIDLVAQGSASFTPANYLDVTLSAGLNNPGNSNESASGALIPMVQFVIDATSASENLEMNSVIVNASGTGDDVTDIATNGILLYRDVNENGIIETGTDQYISSSAGYSADDGTATINLTAYNISSGTQATFVIAYTLSGTASIGNTFIASVAPGGIDLTGASSSESYTAIGSTVTGGTKTINSARSLTVSKGVNSASDQFVSPGALQFSALQVQLSASSSDDVTIDSLKFFATGTMNQNTTVDSVDLYHDLNNNGVFDNGVDTALVTGVTVGTNDTVNFTNISKIISAGTSQNLLVVYTLNGTAAGAQTFGVELSQNSDVYSNAAVSGSPVTSGTFTISSTGQLTLGTGVANPGASNEGVSAQNIVMLQFTLSANETENIEISQMDFTASGSGNDAGDLIASLYQDVNADGVYQSGVDIQYGSAATYNSDNGTLVFNISPGADTLISSDTKTFILVYDFNENATEGETYQAQIATSGITATGINSSNPVSKLGSAVQGGIKTISSIGSLSLSFNNKPPAASVTPDATNAPIFQFRLTASSTENVSVNSITFEEIGTANAATDILVNGIKLYRDVDDDGILNTDVDQFIGTTSGFGGYEVSFDGTGDYIALDANQDQIGGTGSSGITVESWLYFSSAAGGGEHIIASMDRSEYWRLALNGQRRVFWATNSEGNVIDDMTGVTQLSTDTWHHVAAVYEPSTGQKRIYIDGVLDATNEPYADGTVLGSGIARFGFIGTGSEAPTFNGNRGPSSYWWGELDEFRVSSTVRYTSDFTASATSFINDSNTEMLMHFNEGSGSLTANSAIGSGVGDATLFGQTSFTDATQIIENITTIATTGQTIPASTSRDWLLVYDLADSASNGETFQARIASQYELDTSGETFGLPIVPGGTFPVNGNAQTVSNVGALTMSQGASNPVASNIPNSVQDMEMLQLQLTATNAESLEVQSITVKGSGSGVENVDVDSVYIALDLNSNGVYDLGVDQVVSQKYAFAADNGTVVIAMADTLPKAESKNYLIMYDLAGSASNNETFAASIDLNSYISAQGLASASAANISGAPIQGSTMTIQNAPTLTLMPGASNPGDGSITNDAFDVAMMQMNLAAGAGEDVDITSIKYIDIGTGDESAAIDSGNVRVYRDVNNNGTLEPLNDVLLASGNIFLNGDPGNAVSVDGTNDYVNVPDDNNLDVTGDLTIEAWINPSQSAGATYTVVAKRDFGVAGTPTNYSLRVDNYRMRFFFYSPNGSLRDCFDATQRIFPGDWYHIAGVYDATANQMRLYVNGNLVQTSNIGNNDPVANTYPINIGRRYRTGASGGGDSYFNGVIDEVRLSDVVRYTGSQFSVSQVPFTADGNTRLLLHSDDSIGSGTVADSSGNGLDGTLVNGTALVQSTAPLHGGMTIPLLGVSISAGTNEDWLLVYDFNGSANNDETFQSRVLRPVDIQAEGATSALPADNSGLPVTGGLQTITNVGDLTVDVGDNNPPASSIAADASDVVMLQFKMTASAAEAIEVNSITFNAQGSGHDVSDIVSNSIRLYQDVNNNGVFDSGTDTYINQGTAFDADNGSITITTSGQTISAATTQNWILLYSFADSASVNETFFTRIVQNSAVNATGVTSSATIVPGSATFPVTGSIKTISTTGAITLSQGSGNPPNSTISATESNVVMMQLQLASSSAETLKVVQLQFKANGSGDDANDISNIYLYHDLNNNGDLNVGVDTLIAGTGAFAADNGNVTFTFTDSLIFPAGSTQNWLLVYDMSGSAGNSDDFQANVELASYLTGKGAVSGENITVNGSFPVSGAIKTVSSIGTMTITAGANNPNATVEAKNAVNIEMLQINFATSAAESLLIDTLTFTSLGTIDDLNDISFAALYNDINSNGVLDLTIDEQIDSSRAFNADDGTVTFFPSDTLTPSTSVDYLVIYNLSGTASGGETFRVRLDAGDAVIDGIESAGPAGVQGLPLTSAQKTVTDVGSFTLSAGTSNPGNSNITADALRLSMLQFNMSASSVEDINISSVTLRHSGTADPATDIIENKIDLYLDNGNGVYDDGVDTYIGTGSRFQNYAVNMAGGGDYIAVNANQDLAGGVTSDGLTVEAWVIVPSSAGAGEKIIASWDRSDYWRFSIDGQRRVSFDTYGNGGQGIHDMTGSTQLTTDTWHHLAVVYEPSTGQKRIYIDGVLDATSEPYTDGTLIGIGTTRYGFIGVGSEASTFNGSIGPASYWIGDIDEVRISNTVRYTSNFTKPTGEFTSDASTSVLYHFSENGGTITSNAATATGAGDGLLNGGTSFIESDAFPGLTVTIATTGQTIDAGSSEDWILVYDLADSASIGETFISSILKTSIVATGATSGSVIKADGNNVSGGEKTVSAVGSISLAAGSSNPDASTESADALNLEMLQLQLQASAAESLLISEFQIKGQGTANEQTDVTSVYLYRDLNNNGAFDSGVDTQIGTSQSFGADDGVITWTFSPAETLQAGTQENWLVIYNLAGSASNGQTMQTRVELASYMTVTGLTSTRGITPTGTFAIAGGNKTISNIGRLQISLGTNTPPDGTVGLAANDVEVIQLQYVTNSAESLRVDSVRFTPQGTMNHNLAVNQARLYRDVNGNGILDLVGDILLSTTTFNDSLSSVVFTLSDTLPPNTSTDYLLVYELSGGGTINNDFRASIVIDSDVYTTGLSGTPHDGTVLGPPIVGNTLTLSGKGSLTVQTGPANPGSSNEPADAQNLAMMQVRLSAGNVEDININSMTLTAAGTGDDVNDIANNGIKLYRDINSNGVFDSGTDQFIIQGAAYNADNGTITLTTTGQSITKGTTQDWLVVYDLAGTASNGETFRARLLQASDISARGATSDSVLVATGTLPVVGGEKTISSTGSITLAQGSNNSASGPISNNDQDVEMLQLQLSASSAETLLVSQVQFKSSGTGIDQTDVSAVTLYHDLNNNGVFDSGVDTALTMAGTYPGDDGIVTFTFADSVEIPAGSVNNWLLVYDMAGSAANGATFGVAMELNTYMTITGKSSGTPITPAGSFPIAGATKTITSTGILTVTAGLNNPGETLEANNAVNIEMLQINMTSSAAESLMVDTLRLTSLGIIDDVNDVSFVTLYRDINSNGVLDLTIDTQEDSARAFNVDNGKVTFALEDTLPPSTSRDFLVVYNLSGSATGGETFRVRVDVNDIDVTGIESSNPATVQGLPLTSAQKTVTDVGGLTLTAGTSNPGNSNITADAQDLAMLQFNLAASSVEDVNISSVIFRHTGSAYPSTDILDNQIDLYVDNGNGIYDPGTDVFIGNGTKYQNYAVNLGGSGDYIAVDADHTVAGGVTSSGLTVEAWVRVPSSAGGGEKIIASWDRSDYWRFSIDGQRRVSFDTYGSGQGINDMTGSAQLTTDIWHHVAVVYEPSTGQKRIYIDGVLDATTEPFPDGTVLGTGTSRYGFIGVGSEASTFNGTIGPASYWNGDLDEIRISNSVRYTTNFSIPTGEFTPDAATAVLLHFSENGGTFTSNAATVAGAGDGLLNGSTSFIESTAFTGNTVTIATTGQVISAGSSVDWLLVYDLADSASLGETFVANVARTSIVATGVTSGSDVPVGGVNVTGGVKTVSDIGNLTLSNGSNTPPASYIAPGENAVVMHQIQFQASAAETLVVAQFQTKLSGTGDDATGVDSLVIYHDTNSDGLFTQSVDEKLAAAQTVTQNDQVMTFTTGDTIPAGTSQDWIVLAYFSNNLTNEETFRTGIELNTYVSAENLIGVSRTVLGAPLYGNYKTVRDVGTVTVQAGLQNPATGNEGSGETGIEMLQIQLNASSAESLAVQSITITSSGTIDESTDVTGVRLYRDLNNNGVLDLTQDVQLGTTRTFAANDDTVIFAFSPAETLIASSSQNWLVIYDLNGAATAGETFRVNIPANTDFVVQGVESGQSAGVLGAPVTGNFMTIQDIGSLAIYEGLNNPGNSNETANAVNLEMLQINLAASSVENIRIDSLRFSAAGTADDITDIANNGIRLYLDDGDGIYEPGVDNLIGSAGEFDVDNGYFTVITGGEVINANQNENWLLVYDLAGSASQNQTFIARFLQASDIYAVGVSSDSSVFVSVGGVAPAMAKASGTSEASLAMADAEMMEEAAIRAAIMGLDAEPLGGGDDRSADSPIVGGTKTITIVGSLTLSAGTNNPPARNVGSSDTLLTVLQATLRAGNSEDLDISQIRFTASGTGNEATDIASVRLFNDLDGNGQADVTDTQIGTALTYSADNGSVVFSGLTESVTAGATENWLLVYNLNGNANNGEYFAGSVALNAHITATGATTSQSVPVNGAPVNGNNHTVSDEGTLTLSAGVNMPDAANEDGNAIDVTMFQVNLAANSVENISVTSITFTGEGTGDEVSEISDVSLYHDINNNGIYDSGSDTLIGSNTYSGTSVTLGSLTATVNAGTNQNWIVVYGFSGATNGNTFRVRFADNANIIITAGSGNPSAIGAPIVGNYKTISSTGSLTLAEGANNAVDVTLDRTVSNVEMLQISLTASSVENIDITRLVITHQGTGDPINDIVSEGVKLVNDLNGDGIYNVGTEPVLADSSFLVGDTVVFSLSGESITAGSTENWLVVYDFDGGSGHNSTYQARLQLATGVTATGAISASSIVPDGSYPLRGGTITLTTFSNLALAGADLSASPLPGDQNVALLQLNMTVDQNISTVYSIRIDNRAFSGTPDVADVDSIKIFRENGVTGGFQPGEDVLLGGEIPTDDGSGGFAVIAFGSQLDLTGTGGILYVVYDIAPTANITNSVGVLIASTAYLSVNTPTTILDAGDFPIQNTRDYSLPVELSSFVATGEHGAVVLEWVTESEVNNLGFIIERKMMETEDDFTGIASYKSLVELQGQGNSSSQHQYSYRDEKVTPEVNYAYRLIQVDIDGSQRIATNSVEVVALEKLPVGFALNQNYPNPFNPETKIGFSLPQSNEVTIIVYDLLGNKVTEILRNKSYEAGNWIVTWDGRDDHGRAVSTGVYIYNIRSGQFMASKKMTLVK